MCTCVQMLVNNVVYMQNNNKGTLNIMRYKGDVFSMFFSVKFHKHLGFDGPMRIHVSNVCKQFILCANLTVHYNGKIHLDRT